MANKHYNLTLIAEEYDNLEKLPKELTPRLETALCALLEGQSQTDFAEEEGVSRSRAFQLYRKALRILAKANHHCARDGYIIS